MKKPKQFTRQLSAIAKGIMHPVRKPAMERTTANIETINKLIVSDLLALNPVRPYVVISAKLHMLYMQDDRKYANFFYNVLSYINVQRGLMKIEKPVLPEDRLDFSVVQTTTQYVSEEGESWEDMPKDKIKTLLVGIYQNGVVDYECYDKKQ